MFAKLNFFGAIWKKFENAINDADEVTSSEKFQKICGKVVTAIFRAAKLSKGRNAKAIKKKN